MYFLKIIILINFETQERQLIVQKTYCLHSKPTFIIMKILTS